MTYLYFARHGQTADNARRVFQGQQGGSLDAHGRAQAAELAARARAFGLDAIVTSDLARATETATIVGLACGLEPTHDPELREVDVGAWSGKDNEQIKAAYPEEWEAWSRGIDVRRGGGETYAELVVRIERACSRIAATHPDRRVLVVSHGGAIRSYVASLVDTSGRARAAIANIRNTAITLIEHGGDGRRRLHFFNDAAHLEGLAPDATSD